MKSTTDYIIQVIDLAKKCREKISQGKASHSKRLLKSLLKLEDEQIQQVKKETGSDEILEEVKGVLNLIKDAISSIEDNDLDKTKEILNQIIDLEKNDLIEKVARYHKVKEELRQRKKDVDKIKDGLGKRIDPLIKPLVATLIYLGFETTQSCQGHKDHGEQFPWVDMIKSGDFEKLVENIREYNSENNIIWKFTEYNNEGESIVPSLGITRADKKELSQEEIRSLQDQVRDKIQENNLNLDFGNQSNYAIIAYSKKGNKKEELKELESILRNVLADKFRIKLSIPTERKQEKTRLFAEGGSLKEMQQDIIHLSDYLLENF